MKKMRGLWIGLILFLIIAVTAGCSGDKTVIKQEPSGETSQKGISRVVSSQPETPISGAVSEVSKIEKLTESPIPSPRSEVKPTTPAPPPTPPPAPAPPPAPPSPSVSAPEPRRGSGFVFNFDNADLYEVIRVMAEIMKINYLIDPKVKGVVNIRTSGQISAEDVFLIFQTILKLNGATAVKKDSLYEIVPFSDAKKLSVTPSSTLKESAKSVPEERYMIQIVPLKYIPAAEASKLIKPFLSDGADIVEHPPQNILLIGDVASNIKKCLEILSLFDMDIFTEMKVRIYPILNADVTEVAKEMDRIFSSLEVSTKSARGVGITFTPVTRINSLLVVSSIPNIFEKVEGWLKELDRTPAEGTKVSVFVYYCQNAKAKDLADALKSIFAPAKKKEGEFKEKAATATPAVPRGAKPPTPTPSTPGKEEEGGVPEGEITIVVDEATNALIIRAFQRDYRTILETIKKLDIYPKQVLIEVLLAEITLDNANQFGIEWARFITSSNPSRAQEFTLMSQPPTNTSGQITSFLQPLASAANFRYSIVELGGKVAAAINAAASDNRLRVVSSPHILASNNKEARIQVGSSQPILTNTYTTPGVTSTTGAGVVEGTIEYKDIGIILVVTPRISDGGLVTMEVSVENSTVATTTLGTLGSIPVFNKRTAKTVLSIMEGQTVVIGGLIQDTITANKTGIPLLSKIPILGAAFGYQTYDKAKTELLLLMTPHVIETASQSNAVTREFREKIEGLKKDFEEKEKKEKKEKK